MDNIFFLFIGLEDFTEFRPQSLFWVYYLDAFFLHKISGTQQNPNIQTKVQYKWCINFRPNSKCGKNPV
jgi:hypothetical protein